MEHGQFLTGIQAQRVLVQEMNRKVQTLRYFEQLLHLIVDFFLI
jgi:hypothetical protein